MMLMDLEMASKISSITIDNLGGQETFYYKK